MMSFINCTVACLLKWRVRVALVGVMFVGVVERKRKKKRKNMRKR
jgi:hypothetical protein